MSSITQSPKKRGLRVLDPDLPFLAAKVAVDVDILLAGKLKDRSAMTQLAEKLLESTSLSSGVQRPQMDFATLTILRGAVSETANTTSLTEVENLLERAREIAEILRKELRTTTVKNLKKQETSVWLFHKLLRLMLNRFAIYDPSIRLGNRNDIFAERPCPSSLCP